MLKAAAFLCALSIAASAGAQGMTTLYAKNALIVYRLVSGRCNVFLIKSGEKTILVDTSTKTHYSKITKLLEELSIHKIDFIVLTHAHYDHAENASMIARNYNSKIIASDIAAQFLANGKNEMVGGTNTFIKGIVKIGMRFIDRLTYEPQKCDIEIKEDVFRMEELPRLVFLRTPGHTQGSMSIVIDDSIALVGDALFGVFPWSVTSPYCQNVIELKESWLILYNAGAGTYYPSHGSSIKRGMLQRSVKGAT